MVSYRYGGGIFLFAVALVGVALFILAQYNVLITGDVIIGNGKFELLEKPFKLHIRIYLRKLSVVEGRGFFGFTEDPYDPNGIIFPRCRGVYTRIQQIDHLIVACTAMFGICGAVAIWTMMVRTRFAWVVMLVSCVTIVITTILLGVSVGHGLYIFHNYEKCLQEPDSLPNFIPPDWIFNLTTTLPPPTTTVANNNNTFIDDSNESGSDPNNRGGTNNNNNSTTITTSALTAQQGARRRKSERMFAITAADVDDEDSKSWWVIDRWWHGGGVANNNAAIVATISCSQVYAGEDEEGNAGRRALVAPAGQSQGLLRRLLASGSAVRNNKNRKTLNHFVSDEGNSRSRHDYHEHNTHERGIAVGGGDSLLLGATSSFVKGWLLGEAASSAPEEGAECAGTTHGLGLAPSTVSKEEGEAADRGGGGGARGTHNRRRLLQQSSSSSSDGAAAVTTSASTPTAPNYLESIAPAINIPDIPAINIPTPPSGVNIPTRSPSDMIGDLIDRNFESYLKPAFKAWLDSLDYEDRKKVQDWLVTGIIGDVWADNFWIGKGAVYLIVAVVMVIICLFGSIALVFLYFFNCCNWRSGPEYEPIATCPHCEQTLPPEGDVIFLRSPPKREEGEGASAVAAIADKKTGGGGGGGSSNGSGAGALPGDEDDGEEMGTIDELSPLAPGRVLSNSGGGVSTSPSSSSVTTATPTTTTTTTTTTGTSDGNSSHSAGRERRSENDSTATAVSDHSPDRNSSPPMSPPPPPPASSANDHKQAGGGLFSSAEMNTL